MTEGLYSPGSLIRARGREWIVLSGSDAEVLRVRPVSGSEDDQTRIHLALEAEPVRDARFPLPTADQKASHDAALLLRDALLLSLRRGAGPFRSFGQISVEPRAYQLVPLLMALKLDPVRLLIADDVGVGKTIEAALIARELIDRGDVERFAVLCPPHLVDQWVGELEERFHLRAVAVTSTSASRLERDLPPSVSLFEAHAYTVVSLDYIKSEKRRDNFLHHCPELVIVDEAHTCAATGPGRHQRYELLKGLTESSTRHLLLLTATPHSGDDEAFYRLLGLLDRDFQRLGELERGEREHLRERLALHFVQRRRPDIDEWKDGLLFPRRETTELTYKLTGPWERFFEGVLDYCASVVAQAGGDSLRERLNFWGTLALMRCAASSPVAAVLALRSRAGLENGEDEREALLDRLFDGTSDALPEDDVEPPMGTEDPALAALIEQAEKLAGQAGDPKLKLLTEHLEQLIAEGFSPVVFCRYIATAHYLGRHMAARFKDITVGVVTGDFTSDERREKIDALGEAERRLLIATDCLSEGVNLQESFDAVIHYDLSWNPTRHEQREGRVDRFGQTREVVRATLIYGANNPVDGAVLEVILRKGEKIRRELGVPVPLPDAGHTLTQALLKAILLKRKTVAAKQTAFDFNELPEAKLLDAKWTDAREKAKKSQTTFAQRRLRPGDVLPEWHRTLAAVGGKDDVQRFADRALARLGSGLEPMKKGFKAPLAPLPEDARERLEAEGLTGTLLVDFDYPPKGRCRAVQRSHPLIAVLAETLLERTLAADPDTNPDAGVLGRVGCWISGAVQVRTIVALVRLRHQLMRAKGGKDAAGRRSTVLLVEEATAIAWSAAESTVIAEGADALTLIKSPPAGDPPLNAWNKVIAQALEQIGGATHVADLEAFASRRAQALLADHERVRESSRDRGRHEVHALLPPDVIGLFVLLPKVN
jgi:superfamily II DNA or RNA helicase